MNNQEVIIRNATPADAQLIGWGLCEAIGAEIVNNLAVNTNPRTVERFFSELAERDDTQYSWKNTLVAEIDGIPAGVAVSYDGALLHELRKLFFQYAAALLKLYFGNVEDETDASEFYLDTLAVKPEFRGHKIARKLIKATAEKATHVGKPLGLLVDDDNLRAQKLYASCGFREIGRRPFAGVEMKHLQLFD